MMPTPTPTNVYQTESIRALIFENATFNREGVEPFLRPHRDIVIVGMTGDLATAIHMAHRFSPQVVIVNLDDELDTARIVRDLRKRVPNARVLVMLGRNEPATARVLRHAGADELLFGTPRPADVVGVVRRLGHAAHNDRSTAASA